MPLVPIPLDLPVEVQLPEVPRVAVPAPAELLPVPLPLPRRAVPQSHGGSHLEVPPLPPLEVPPVRPVQRRPRPPGPPPAQTRPDAPSRPQAQGDSRVPAGIPSAGTGGLRLPDRAPPVMRVGELAVTGPEAYGAASGLAMLVVGFAMWRWSRRFA